MSGGTAVQTERHGGVRAQPQASHGHGFRTGAQAKCLVLTEDGPARPQTNEKKCQPFTAGDRSRKGWMPHGRDYRLGSRQPDPSVTDAQPYGMVRKTG